MPPSKLLLEVADYCWSNSFLDVFRNFFAKHAEDFEGAPPMHNGEHDLKYYNLFQTYLKLYETTLETYLKKLDIPIEDFYNDVRDAQGEAADPYITVFIDCLLASADYDSFYKVMSREGHRSLTLKQMKAKTPAPGESSSAKSLPAESKAESKGGDDEYASDKKSSDYDDGAEEKRSHK